MPVMVDLWGNQVVEDIADASKFFLEFIPVINDWEVVEKKVISPFEAEIRLRLDNAVREEKIINIRLIVQQNKMPNQTIIKMGSGLREDLDVTITVTSIFWLEAARIITKVLF
jgi:hypothetical protein